MPPIIFVGKSDSNFKNMGGQHISLLPIYLVIFIGSLGFSLVLPFLVFLVFDFGGNAFVYGILGATYPLFQLIGAPFLGRWSDIHGRRRILLLSQLGTLFSWMVFLAALYLPSRGIIVVTEGFTLTLPLAVLFFARGLDGLTGGNVSVAYAYLSDYSAESERSKNFGRISIASNLGFVLGPALAGVLSTTSLEESLPVLLAIVISFVGTLLILFLLKEVSPCKIDNADKRSISRVFGQETSTCYLDGVKERKSFKEVLRFPNVAFMISLIFLVFLGFNIFYTSLPLHAVFELEWGVSQIGIYLTVLGLLMGFVQGPVLSHLSKMFKEAKLIVIGSFLLATNFLVFSISPSLVYVSVILFAFGNGLMWPSLLTMLSKLSKGGNQGTVQGISSSFNSLASIMGLILGGALYSAIGVRTFILVAVISYSVMAVSLRLPRLEKK